MARQVGGGDAFKVKGLAAFRRELKKAGKNVDAQLKAINVAVSGEIITAAQGNAAGVSKMAARAAESLVPYRSARAGGVNLRATRSTPYAMGAEFGSARDQIRSRAVGGAYVGYRQFKPWLGNSDGAGYFLWPAIRAADVEAKYLDALTELVHDLASGGGDE